MSEEVPDCEPALPATAAALLPSQADWQEGQVCVAGAISEAVPGSEPALPAAAALPASDRRAESKPAKPSKPAAKPAKPVELPPAEFQTQEPFVPPAAKSKVCPPPPLPPT